MAPSFVCSNDEQGETLLTNGEDEMALRTWALLGARAGDNDQVIALAQALGLPFELKQLHYNRLHILGPRLLGRSLASLSRASRAAVLDEPPPDLTISTGHRSVPVVRALRQRSAGSTRSIHIGFPRVSPGHFDLVITTPQYGILDQRNLLKIPYALTRAATEVAGAAGQLEIANFPEPRRLLIVGGPTLFWELDQELLIGKLAEMLEDASLKGGSVLVTFSPRTPSPLRSRINSMLSNSAAKTLLAQPGRAPSYASLLAAASTLHVTADSVSMISDAIWTRKPLALVPVRMSAMGRMIFAANDRLRPRKHAYPQDLRFFWRALEGMGIGEGLALPRTSPGEVITLVRQRAGEALNAP